MLFYSRSELFLKIFHYSLEVFILRQVYTDMLCTLYLIHYTLYFRRTPRKCLQQRRFPQTDLTNDRNYHGYIFVEQSWTENIFVDGCFIRAVPFSTI